MHHDALNQIIASTAGTQVRIGVAHTPTGDQTPGRLQIQARMGRGPWRAIENAWVQAGADFDAHAERCLASLPKRDA